MFSASAHRDSTKRGENIFKQKRKTTSHPVWHGQEIEVWEKQELSLSHSLEINHSVTQEAVR